MPGETTRRANGGSAVGSAELCNRKFTCDNDATYDWFSVGPVFEDLGPRIEYLVAHASCTEKSSANLKYALRIKLSYDGRTWYDGYELISDANADYKISGKVDDPTKLGRCMRFEVGVNGNNSFESANLEVTLYWRYAT